MLQPCAIQLRSPTGACALFCSVAALRGRVSSRTRFLPTPKICHRDPYAPGDRSRESRSDFRGTNSDEICIQDQEVQDIMKV